MEQHSSGKPVVDETCAATVIAARKNAALDAIIYENNVAHIVQELWGCGRCIGACAFILSRPSNGMPMKSSTRKMAEYAQAVSVRTVRASYQHMVMDISPNCDCHAETTRLSAEHRHVALTQ